MPPGDEQHRGQRATERHEQALVAVFAPQSSKAAAEPATVEVGLQLLAGVLREAHRDRAVQRLEPLPFPGARPW